jgi:DNA-binding CsgD family transcriptional regulator
LSLAYQVLAWEAAARGQAEQAEQYLSSARRLIQLAGTSAVAEHLLRVAAFCAMCRNDLEQVVACLEPRLTAPGRSGHAGDRLPVAPLLVEAYLGLRRYADAAALARRYAEANPAPRPQAVQALAQRCLGLTADDHVSAGVHFDAALAAHTGWNDPFEAARTRLLYGSVLRRAGQRTAARSHLRAAHDALAGMDLTVWADRAAAELEATGQTAKRRSAGRDEPLTSQETRVALLVARGMTNKEIAAALFLSPKTVEHHTTNIYRKRGLRSRTELARLFADASLLSETDPQRRQGTSG